MSKVATCDHRFPIRDGSHSRCSRCGVEPTGMTKELLSVWDNLAAKERFLLRRLAIDQPWSWSQEGLDDCCIFCGATESTWLNPGHRYVHEPECVWLAAREFLGRSQPEHVRAAVDHNGADE